MRQKKSVLQIGEETYHENPNFKIQIPADYNEQQSSFEKKSSITKLKHMFSNPQLMNPQQQNHRNHYRKNPQNSLTCCSSSEALLATKTVVLKVLKLNHVKLFWIKAPSRVLILLCLPSVYFFSLNYHQSLYLYILFLITLCILLLSLLNLPSIRLFIARNLSIFNLSNIGNATKISPPVVWSIGSKNQFESSTITGFLVKVYSNGDVYEGEFYKGKCSGSGVYYYSMNGRYEGDWIDQKYDGYGVETWAKGSRYRGQYRQGLRHGYGVYRFFTGDMYAGEWIKGQCHGRGVHTCDDGSKYFGEFKGGVKHGLGHYHFRNGDMYAGEYFADRMHGFGVYNFANGHRYEGAWHEGRRQGFGMYSFRNGDTQLGHWNDGVLTVSPPSVPNSKVLNSVEEARRMAEKAIGGDVVEEKVNRAVAAANRAANAARVAAVKAVQRRVDHRTDIDDPTLLIV